jgi:uncharacterized membrane protein
MENREAKTALKRNEWLKIGLKTAVFSVLSVLVVQAIALSIWPEIVMFKPLDSYPRSALFTLIPAIGATLVLAWLAKRESHPGKKFLMLSAVLLLLSFIPDYALPLPGKTFLASSVAAFMHLTAGVVTVATIVTSYHKRAA